jgi:Na+-driven multidrug efflux pump
MLLTASLSVCAEFINIFIDKIVAARMLGENALAAISFFTPLFSVILFASSIVMVGSLVCYSIELGRMNKNKADRFFGQSIILSVTIGILMVIAFAIGKRLLFNYMDVDPGQMQFVN